MFYLINLILGTLESVTYQTGDDRSNLSTALKKEPLKVIKLYEIQPHNINMGRFNPQQKHSQNEINNFFDRLSFAYVEMGNYKNSLKDSEIAFYKEFIKTDMFRYLERYRTFMKYKNKLESQNESINFRFESAVMNYKQYKLFLLFNLEEAKLDPEKNEFMINYIEYCINLLDFSVQKIECLALNTEMSTFSDI